MGCRVCIKREPLRSEQVTNLAVVILDGQFGQAIDHGLVDTLQLHPLLEILLPAIHDFRQPLITVKEADVDTTEQTYRK